MAELAKCPGFDRSPLDQRERASTDTATGFERTAWEQRLVGWSALNGVVTDSAASYAAAPGKRSRTLRRTLAKMQPLSEAWIQQLHAVVIVRGRGRRRQRTPYRSTDVSVVDNLTRRIDYAPPFPDHVPARMGQLCQWWQGSEHLPALVRAALLSHRFISIHPFDDGNGRCGRLLATASLWRCGYDFRGFLSIEEWFSRDREAYYAALQLGCPINFYDGRHDPDHSPWLVFFTGVVCHAAAALAQQAKALQVQQQPMDPHLWEALDRRSQQLLTRLRARVAAGQADAQLFKPGDLEGWFAISSTTAQEWLRSWERKGFLRPAREGQRIRTWRLAQPWVGRLLSQPEQRE